MEQTPLSVVTWRVTWWRKRKLRPPYNSEVSLRKLLAMAFFISFPGMVLAQSPELETTCQTVAKNFLLNTQSFLKTSYGIWRKSNELFLSATFSNVQKLRSDVLIHPLF